MVQAPTTERTAHVITSACEAIEIAQQLSVEFAKESAVRDSERRLPYTEMDKLSQSGVLAITVPKEYGGGQIMHVAIDVGIADAALADTKDFVHALN